MGLTVPEPPNQLRMTEARYDELRRTHLGLSPVQLYVCPYCDTITDQAGSCTKCGAPTIAAEDRPKRKPSVQPTPDNTKG